LTKSFSPLPILSFPLLWTAWKIWNFMIKKMNKKKGLANIQIWIIPEGDQVRIGCLHHHKFLSPTEKNYVILKEKKKEECRGKESTEER
jgi:hypothetical protein